MAMSLFAAVGGVPGTLGMIAIAVMGLGLVYVAHELGHLLAAKACGVRLSKYYLGFHVATDPRSFAAKAVWQRIVVIAAGSLMNVLLAVTLTAVAHRLGVSYMPCVLGGTVAGAPAWALGLRPGDKILQIGRSGQTNECLRFDKDLMIAVTLHGAATELDLLIRRYGQPQPEWVRIQPSDRLQHLGRPATLGIHPAHTTRLDDSWPPPGDRGADAGRQTLLPGDEIVAVNQVPLPRDQQAGEVLGHHLEAAFAQNMTEPLTLTVLRRAESAGDAGPVSTQRLEIIVPPTPMRVLGLTMQIGPIVAVRAGSPAQNAGFRVGDVFLAIDGEEVGDPLTLTQRWLPLVGRRIEVTVRREDDGPPVALRVTPHPPRAYEISPVPESLLALDSLGVALRVENVIQSVDPDGPAWQAGLRAGDEITEVRFLAADAAQGRDTTSGYGTFSEQPIALSVESPNWPFVHACLQAAGAGAQVAVTYRREEAIDTALIEPVESKLWFRADRGLYFEPLRQLRAADSWSEACALGLRDTRAQLDHVVTLLCRLVTRELPPSNLGGPIMAARAGTAEASEGTPRLLLFLAFVSVNFAVLCCLPIPGLDGGHLLFLVAEGLRGKPVSRRLQLVVIAVAFFGLTFVACSLVLPCLSQLFRLIGLIRAKDVARSDAA